MLFLSGQPERVAYKLLKPHLSFRQRLQLWRKGVVEEDGYLLVVGFHDVRLYRMVGSGWQFGCIYPKAGFRLPWPDEILAYLLAIRANPWFDSIPHWDYHIHEYKPERGEYE